MTLAPLLARLERGFRRMWAWVRVKVTGRRDHRFAGEQANLADQLAQTQTSLGLLAAAAQHLDDEHRLQALQTEQMLRDRQRVLEKNRRKRGLADEERWELESINRGLDELAAPATPETHGEQRLADFGDLPSHLVRTSAPARPAGFMAPMAAMAVRPWMIWTGAVVLLLGALGIQTGRLENAKADLREERAEVAGLQEEVMLANAERDMLREAVSAATQQSAQAAETIEAERARRLRAEREARSIRNAMEQARRGESVDYGFGGVRNDGAVSPGPGGGDTAGRRPS